MYVTMADAKVLMPFSLLTELFSSANKRKEKLYACVRGHCFHFAYYFFFVLHFIFFFFNKMRNLSCLRWINSTCARLKYFTQEYRVIWTDDIRDLLSHVAQNYRFTFKICILYFFFRHHLFASFRLRKLCIHILRHVYL